MLPVYESLMGLDPAPRILVYSGDVDGCVPHLGTRRWVSSLGLPPAEPWRSWHSTTGASSLVLRLRSAAADLTAMPLLADLLSGWQNAAVAFLACCRIPVMQAAS